MCPHSSFPFLYLDSELRVMGLCWSRSCLHAGEAATVNGRMEESRDSESWISLQHVTCSGCKYEAVGFQTAPAGLEAPSFTCEVPFKRDTTRKRFRRRHARVFLRLLSHKPRFGSTVPSCRCQMKRLFIPAQLVHHSFDQVLFLLLSRGSCWLKPVQLQSSRDVILIVLQEWGSNEKKMWRVGSVWGGTSKVLPWYFLKVDSIMWPQQVTYLIGQLKIHSEGWHNSQLVSRRHLPFRLTWLTWWATRWKKTTSNDLVL